MTTGPENYRKAQVLLVDAEENFSPGDPEYLTLATAAAAFATLALAAATALRQKEVPGDDSTYSTSALPFDDYDAWWKAASEGPAALQRREEGRKAEREEVMTELRGASRDTQDTGTEAWFRASKAAGCTGTAYDTDTDSILHENPGPCPVHPGLPD